MKKNIVIIILSISLVLLIFYGLAQQTIAERSTQIALANEKIALEQKAIAEVAEMRAVAEAERARIAEESARASMIRAQKALEKCK